MIGMLRGRSASDGAFSVMPNAGTASAARTPTDTTSVVFGARRLGRSTARQNRDEPVFRMESRHSNGIRGLSTHRPSFASNAGSTVIEPIIAASTTRMVPTAMEENTMSLTTNMPAIATVTAMPDTTIAWPDVAAAISTASTWLAPFARSSRSRRT